jgi:5-methylcytosine-specific restriction protein A
MPTAPPRACGRCGQAGCSCARTVRRQRIERGRRTARERGYSTLWDKATKAYLKAHAAGHSSWPERAGLCAGPGSLCQKGNWTRAATLTDHIKPHRGDAKLFWDPTNWEPLCVACHNYKTATEDSSFARRRGAAPATVGGVESSDDHAQGPPEGLPARAREMDSPFSQKKFSGDPAPEAA